MFISEGVPLLGKLERCIECLSLFEGPRLEVEQGPSGIAFHHGEFPTIGPGFQMPEVIEGRSKSFYVTPWFDRGGEIASAIWKFEKRARDIYVLSSAFPEAKISIHGSGIDNLSLNFDIVKKQGTILKNRQRHIAKRVRARAPLATLMRIFRIEVLHRLPSWPGWRHYVGKERSKWPLMIGKPADGILDNLIFLLEAYYTCRPLEEYKGTSGLPRQYMGGRLLKTWKIRDSEWIHFYAGWTKNPTKGARIQHSLDKIIDKTKAKIATLALGEFAKGSLFVGLAHK